MKKENYLVKNITIKDIYLILKARNSQLNVLRNRYKKTKSQQLEYFNNFIKNQYNKKKPDQLLKSIYSNNEWIGYGGLTNINWHDLNAELSFLLNNNYNKSQNEYKKVFDFFLKKIFIFSFNELKLDKIYTETYSFRKFHIKILEKNGFKYEGTKKKHIIIESKKIDILMHGKFKK
tara:strand:- start:38986 stop:39513 length:528 start_codon:yes stop_codon:yes gene_type:complete